MIKEIPIFPQFVTDTGRGKLGQRCWTLDCCEDNIDKFLAKVAKSHWRSWNGDVDSNTVPVSIQVGAFDEKLNMKHDMSDDPHWDIDVPLLKCGTTKVVAQYQFLLFSNCWPLDKTKAGTKPEHPKDTVLSLEIKGSGQFLTINPMALRGAGSAQAACDPSMMNRIVIPITEYHLVCERLTRQQCAAILSPKDPLQAWKNMEGCVNDDEFLGEKPGTIVFDTWSLGEMFVADPDDPVRWRLGVNLRCREVWDREGKLPDADLQPPPYPDGPSASMPGGSGKESIGWNWDYHTDGARGSWQYIQMLDDQPYILKIGLGPAGVRPRYPYRKFAGMFCESNCHPDDLCLENLIGEHAEPQNIHSSNSVSSSHAND